MKPTERVKGGREREKRKYIDALSLVEQQKEFSFIVRYIDYGTIYFYFTAPG